MNLGVYGINRDHYRSWMQNLLGRLGYANVDYIGPWNEDQAYYDDYADVDVGIPVVGVETYGLDTAKSRYVAP